MLWIIFYQKLISDFGLSDVTPINSSSSSSISTSTKSSCSCAINSNMCTENCCCDPSCPSQKFDICLPSEQYHPSKMVKMCSEYGDDSIGSVTTWIMRTMLCVYTDNNPVTKEEYVDFTNTPEAAKYSVGYVLQNTPAPVVFLSAEDAGVVSANKKNRGFLFGQEIGLAINTTNVLFGYNTRIEEIVSSMNTTIDGISSTVKVAPYIADTIDISFPTATTIPTTANHVQRTISIFYYSYGYKYGPQYVIKEASVVATTGSYGMNSYNGFSQGNIILQTIVKFYEIPNNNNFNNRASENDESSWLPFGSNSINI